MAARRAADGCDQPTAAPARRVRSVAQSSVSDPCGGRLHGPIAEVCRVETGFAEQARATTGARVWIHEHDVQMAAPERSGRGTARPTRICCAARFRTVLALGMRGATKDHPIQEVSGFSGGEVLDVPGSPRVVHAHGHTDGSAAILLEDRAVLFTGDVLCTRNAYTGRVGPQVMPSGLNADTRQALASLANLCGRRPASRTHSRRASTRSKPCGSSPAAARTGPRLCSPRS
jgi:hypothetical protein